MKHLSSKTLSVIIPFYNGFTYIERALESVMNQTFLPADFEIIVVDDASTDEKTKSFLTALETKYTHVKTLRLTENKGPAFARNFGIKQAVGEFIAFLDCDDVWPKYKLKHQLNALLNSELDIVGGATQYYFEPDQKPELNFKHANNIIYHVHLGAVIARRNVFFEKALWFDTNRRFSEDFDWWLRSLDADLKIEMLQLVVLHYHLHGQNMTATEKNDDHFNILSVLHASIKQRKNKVGLMGIEKHKEEMPPITVIIPLYNGAEFIHRALKSVFLQHYHPLEIIVVDDGSTDMDSALLKVDFPSITLIKTENKGVAAARNLAIRESSFDYIAFLDQDDEWLENKLYFQIKTLMESKDANWVTCDYHAAFDESLRERPAFLNNDIFKKDHEAFVPSAFVFKRELFTKYGYFDESLRFTSDSEYIKRLNNNGEQRAKVSKVLMVKHWHNNNEMNKRDELKREFLFMLSKGFRNRNNSSS